MATWIKRGLDAAAVRGADRQVRETVDAMIAACVEALSRQDLDDIAFAQAQVMRIPHEPRA